jgi:hypothetical protein
MSNNKPHNFLVTLAMDGKIIATRNTSIVEYNDNIIWSLRLNKLMKEMTQLIEDSMKDTSVKEGHRLVRRGTYTGGS